MAVSGIGWKDMEQLTELEIVVFQLRMGLDQADRCIDWAVERLRLDQEGDDLEVVLLASARGRDHRALPGRAAA
jgi:hypothetical protein